MSCSLIMRLIAQQVWQRAPLGWQRADGPRSAWQDAESDGPGRGGGVRGRRKCSLRIKYTHHTTPFYPLFDRCFDLSVASLYGFTDYRQRIEVSLSKSLSASHITCANMREPQARGRPYNCTSGLTAAAADEAKVYGVGRRH